MCKANFPFLRSLSKIWSKWRVFQGICDKVCGRLVKRNGRRPDGDPDRRYDAISVNPNEIQVKKTFAGVNKKPIALF